MANVSDLSVSIVDSNDLPAIREDWNALVDRMPYPSVFVTWEWVNEWWRHFSDGRQLIIIVVKRSRETIAVLPLYCEVKRLGREGRVGRVLQYCGARELYPDPLDIVAAGQDSAASVEAVLEFLHGQSNSWDVLSIAHATGESALGSALTAVGARKKQVSLAPYLAIQGTYDQYLMSLSANERSNIRKRIRKLVQGMGVTYADLGGDDAREALARLFALHGQRAEQKGIRSSFDQPAIKAFHMGLLAAVDRRRFWLRGFRRNDDILAVFYGFSVANRISYYQLGFDPAYEGVSLGSALLQETIREAFGRDYCEYNFLQGDEAFKFRWTSDVRPLYVFDYFNASWKGRLSRVMLAGKGRALAVIATVK